MCQAPIEKESPKSQKCLKTEWLQQLAINLPRWRQYRRVCVFVNHLYVCLCFLRFVLPKDKQWATSFLAQKLTVLTASSFVSGINLLCICIMRMFLCFIFSHFGLLLLILFSFRGTFRCVLQIAQIFDVPYTAQDSDFLAKVLDPGHFNISRGKANLVSTLYTILFSETCSAYASCNFCSTRSPLCCHSCCTDK